MPANLLLFLNRRVHLPHYHIITNPRIASQYSPFNRFICIFSERFITPRDSQPGWEAAGKQYPHHPKTNRIYYIFSNSFDELTFNFDLITKLHFISEGYLVVKDKYIYTSSLQILPTHTPVATQSTLN